MFLITYASDVAVLQVELAEIYSNAAHDLNSLVTRTDDGEYKFASGNHVPVFYTESGGSICATAGIDRDVLESCESLTVLGEIIDRKYIFDSDDAESLYTEQRGDLTANYIDDDGVEQTCSKPFKIGAFV